jgi:hypothetical protein
LECGPRQEDSIFSWKTVIGINEVERLSELFVAGPAGGRFRRRLRTSKPVSAYYTPDWPICDQGKKVHRFRELWLDEMEHCNWILNARRLLEHS